MVAIGSVMGSATAEMQMFKLLLGIHSKKITEKT
jgi:hypothetical protein